MSLILSVPSVTKRVMSEIEIFPPRVEKVLSSLPLLNITETSRKLFSMLYLNNRVDINDRTRLELLEMYRKPAHTLGLELQKQYIGQPLPLTNVQKIAAERNREFQIELAMGYKRLVLNEAALDQPAATSRVTPQAALIVQRAMHHLAEVVATSNERYSPCPADVWREIHTLYRHAETRGLTDIPVPDTLNKSVPATSIAHVYKQALLLNLTDPYRLPARFTEIARHYLDRWANVALLLPANSIFDPICQFLIDQETDGAGIIHDQESMVDAPGRYRLLNTATLARVAHAHVKLLNQDPQTNIEGMVDVPLNDKRDILRRLVHAWSLHPIRGFRRNRRPLDQMNVAIGLDAASFWLNGGSPVLVSSTFIGPMPKRMVVTRPELEIAHASPIAVHESAYESGLDPLDTKCAAWNIRDESAGGFSLTHQEAAHMRVRVGDLIAVRSQHNTASWSIATIRWAKSNGPSQIEIGAQRIAPAAEPVVIKFINDEGKESDLMPALRLPEIKALRHEPSLITPRGIFRPERRLFLDDGLRLYHIAITRVLEITSAFERFQFQVLEAA